MMMHTIPLRIAITFIVLVPCTTSSISIVDATYAFPFVRSVDDSKTPMQWDSGTAIQLLSSCQLVRITRRGIRCISAGIELVEGWEKKFTREGLTSESCLPHSKALCVMTNGNRFFPTDTVYVSDDSVAKCVNGQGRQLVPDQNTSLGSLAINGTGAQIVRDDISLCDILDTNLDVIYDPAHNQIFTKQLNNSAWLYVSISILILIVVVLMAEALSNNTHSNLVHNIIAWVLLVLLSILMLTHTDGRMHPIITVHDTVFMWIILVYITISTVYWIAASHSRVQDDNVAPKTEAPEESKTAPTNPVLQESPDPPPPDAMEKAVQVLTNTVETQRDGLNSMLASIQLATCVLYGTADNVYVSGIFFVLLLRCMQKLHAAHYNPTPWTIYANTVIVMDVTYTALVLLFAVLPHYGNDTETILYTAAQYVICDTIASNLVLSSAIAASTAAMITATPKSKGSELTPADKLANQRGNDGADIGPANAGERGE